MLCPGMLVYNPWKLYICTEWWKQLVCDFNKKTTDSRNDFLSGDIFASRILQPLNIHPPPLEVHTHHAGDLLNNILQK